MLDDAPAATQIKARETVTVMTMTRDTQLPLAKIRRDLIDTLTKLPGEGDVMVWQRQLAEAIIAAETNPKGYDVAERSVTDIFFV